MTGFPLRDRSTGSSSARASPSRSFRRCSSGGAPARARPSSSRRDARRRGGSSASRWSPRRSAPTRRTSSPTWCASAASSENWLWWSFLLTGMMTVFFYARLWRRSGVLTDLEFYEIRYSGKAATFLRGFRAIYLGLFFNCVIMATVNLAAVEDRQRPARLADGAHAPRLRA